jgi:hypothetical protein
VEAGMNIFQERALERFRQERDELLDFMKPFLDGKMTITNVANDESVDATAAYVEHLKQMLARKERFIAAYENIDA